MSVYVSATADRWLESRAQREKWAALGAAFGKRMFLLLPPEEQVRRLALPSKGPRRDTAELRAERIERLRVVREKKGTACSS